MSAELAPAEIQLFYGYLGRRLSNGGGDLSPEESVREFRAYQAELQRFIDETQQAEQQSKSGQAKPLDLDALRQKVEQRIANAGMLREENDS